MFGYIILRDIPKEAAQLDLLFYEIQGGFRGFAQVLPGPHFVSIKVDGEIHEGFWCYLEPSRVVVKVFNYENKLFQEDNPENELKYSNLALSGAMNKALIPVMLRSPEMAMDWIKLVSYIKIDNFPFTLHSETPIIPPENLSSEEMSAWFLDTYKSRFEQAFFETHGGNKDSFLAEFQFAFVRSLVKKTDDEALKRWLCLLQAVYNVGERNIKAVPDLFPPLIDIIMAQFKYLPEDWFKPNSQVVYGVSYLIEDMTDTGIEELIEKAKNFKDFLKLKGVGIE